MESPIGRGNSDMNSTRSRAVRIRNAIQLVEARKVHFARAEMNLTSELKRLNNVNRPITPGVPLKRCIKISNFSSKINFDDMRLEDESTVAVNFMTAVQTSQKASKVDLGDINSNFKALVPGVPVESPVEPLTPKIPRSNPIPDCKQHEELGETPSLLTEPVRAETASTRSRIQTESSLKRMTDSIWEEYDFGSFNDKAQGDAGFSSHGDIDYTALEFPEEEEEEAQATSVSSEEDIQVRNKRSEKGEVVESSSTIVKEGKSQTSKSSKKTRKTSPESSKTRSTRDNKCKKTDFPRTEESDSRIDVSQGNDSDEEESQSSESKTRGKSTKKTFSSTNISSTGSATSKTGRNGETTRTSSESPSSDTTTTASSPSETVEVCKDEKRGAIMFKVPGRLTHKTTIKVAHFPQAGCNGNAECVIHDMGPDPQAEAASQAQSSAMQQMMAYQQYYSRAMYCNPYSYYYPYRGY